MSLDDEEDEIQKGNALIRANLHIDPYELSPENWALFYNQAVWLEGFRLRNTAKMLVRLFDGKEQ